MQELTDELTAVVVLAAAHAIDSVRAGGPLLPFVLSESPLGARRLQRLAPGGSVEQVRELARGCIADDAIVAVAYGGQLAVHGASREAIYVEAAEPGGPTFRFAQPYAPRGRVRRLRAVGTLAFLGQGVPFAA